MSEQVLLKVIPLSIELYSHNKIYIYITIIIIIIIKGNILIF
jgi:hypothetical protein